jgi:hypothetical protein
MKANIRIGVVPVPAGPMAPVDERNRRLRFAQKRVGESHAHGARADDQIVGFDRVTGHDLFRRKFSALSHSTLDFS